MNNTNYSIHENDYKLLRQNGFQGWGGESFEQRMKGWQATVDVLLASNFFPASDARILELGSGAGDSLLPFANKGYSVSGIEISPTAVQWANEKFEALGHKASFVQGSIVEPFPFANNSFDVVMDAACLHCIIGTDRFLAFKEIHRVLRPSGFLLISHMVNDPRQLGAEMKFNSDTRTQERSGLPYRSMPTLDQLISEMSSADFKINHKIVRNNSWWDHAELWCSKI